MKTSFLFFVFAIFLSEISATFFWWEAPSDHQENNLKKCFHKLDELNIDPIDICYSKLTDLGTTYEQYYCRINEHTPHPYWQLKMTFLKSKKLEVSLVSTMMPILLTVRYDVKETHIKGVFELEDEITGGNKRLMAILKAKDGIFIYYMCSFDNWHYNDYHLNTDDKYPVDRSFGNNFGMPDYFRRDWWNWWKIGDWDWFSWWKIGDLDNDWFFPRRRHDHDDRHNDRHDDRHHNDRDDDRHHNNGHDNDRDCEDNDDHRHEEKDGHDRHKRGINKGHVGHHKSRHAGHNDKRGDQNNTHNGQNNTHNGHNNTHNGHNNTHNGHNNTHNGHNNTHNSHNNTHNSHNNTHNSHNNTHNSHNNTHNGNDDGHDNERDDDDDCDDRDDDGRDKHLHNNGRDDDDDCDDRDDDGHNKHGHNNGRDDDDDCDDRDDDGHNKHGHNNGRDDDDDRDNDGRDRHDDKHGRHNDGHGRHNDGHGRHDNKHDDDDDRDGRNCRHTHDYESLKKELRCHVKCEHCHYFPVRQFPWWGCRLTLTKRNLRRTADYFNRDMMTSWDFFTWPYYFFN